MKVKEVMAPNAQAIWLTESLTDAARMMWENDCGVLPIVKDQKVVGMITDRDITIRSVAQGRDPRLAPVSEIMTPTAFYCFEDEEIEHVGEQMQQKEVRRLLILDRDKNLVGVVSLGDIAKTAGESTLAGETLGEIAEAA